MIERSRVRLQAGAPSGNNSAGQVANTHVLLSPSSTRSRSRTIGSRNTQNVRFGRQCDCQLESACKNRFAEPHIGFPQKINSKNTAYRLHYTNSWDKWHDIAVRTLWLDVSVYIRIQCDSQMSRFLSSVEADTSPCYWTRIPAPWTQRTAHDSQCADRSWQQSTAVCMVSYRQSIGWIK